MCSSDLFLAAIDAAAAAADRLVTFGIVADRPETGYGYIRRGSALDGGRLYSISSFVEKPSIDKARQFLSSGDYTWNSGIFLMSSKTYWSEYENFHADSAAIVQAALSKAVIDPDFVRLDGESFSRAKNESIDYAVMEHTNKGAVVPVEMRWNDVGAWDALWDLAQKSAPGSNVQLGDVITIDCQNSYFRSEHGLLAAIGVEDLAVVVTPDAVLVAPKGQAQTVKRLVDEMKRLEREEVLLPATVYRPWGTYRSIHRGDNVQAKHITVRPGGKLSLQMHHRRAEHWVIVAGEARVTVESQELVLGPNQSIFIPKTARHRLENLGDVDVHLIEVQCGDYLGEDDIVRFDDIYGRTGPS